MKKINLSAAMVAVLGMTAVTSAFADPTVGKLSFTGQVMAGDTCAVGAEVGADMLVSLDKISASALAAAGSYAGTKNFDVAVGGGVGDTCNGSITQLVFAGENINADGYLDNDGTATNIGVRLLNGDTHAPINLLNGVNNPHVVPVPGTPAVVHYQAQYYSKVGQVTSGTVYTGVTYIVSY